MNYNSNNTPTPFFFEDNVEKILWKQTNKTYCEAVNFW